MHSNTHPLFAEVLARRLSTTWNSANISNFIGNLFLAAQWNLSVAATLSLNPTDQNLGVQSVFAPQKPQARHGHVGAETSWNVKGFCSFKSWR
jgi:hypothetical protein